MRVTVLYPEVAQLVGFQHANATAGAPRFLGTDGKREILTFIDGEVPADPAMACGPLAEATVEDRSTRRALATVIFTGAVAKAKTLQHSIV
jgi:hypothetical protein